MTKAEPKTSSTENSIVSADRRTLFVVLLLGVADRIEFSGGRKHGTSEPDGISLHEMGDDLDIDWGRLDSSLGDLLGDLHTFVDGTLDVSLQSSSEIFEHGASTGEDDVGVETSTGVDRTALDGLVDDDRERSEEIRGENFGVEEQLGCEESLVTDVDDVLLLADRLHESVFFDEFLWLGVVFVELFDEVGADVGVLLFGLLGDSLSQLGRDGVFFTIELEGTNELCDVAACERDVFDGASNDISFSHWNDVGHSITRIDHSSGQCLLLHFLAGP